jgi:competence CoiA-like predicted nuclease
METVQHELMKSIMEKSLSRICEGIAVDDPKVRVGNFYPDILAINCRTIKGLVNIICEVQYSNIDPKEVKAKTITYSREGYYTLWVFAVDHLIFTKRRLVRIGNGEKFVLHINHDKFYLLDYNTSNFGVYILSKSVSGKTTYLIKSRCWGKFPEDFILIPDIEVVDDNGVKYKVKVLKVFCKRFPHSYDHLI